MAMELLEMALVTQGAMELLEVALVTQGMMEVIITSVRLHFTHM